MLFDQQNIIILITCNKYFS